MKSGSAWDFGPDNRLFSSNSNKWHLYYQDCMEIAMGAPIGGKLYLKDNYGKIFFIDSFAAGPPVWHNQNDKFVVPKWTKNKGQELWLIDLDSFTKTIFDEEFRVLEIDFFDDNYITGIDSPIHNPRKLKLSGNEIGITIPLSEWTNDLIKSSKIKVVFWAILFCYILYLIWK